MNRDGNIGSGENERYRGEGENKDTPLQKGQMMREK